MSREGLSLLRKKGSLFAPSTIYLPFLTSKMSTQMSLVLFALSGYFLNVLLLEEVVKNFLERLLAYWYTLMCLTYGSSLSYFKSSRDLF